MPSKKKDEAGELAGRMLTVLQSQRGLGGESYPLTLGRLAQLTDPQAAREQVQKAVSKKLFKEGTVLSGNKTSPGLVALKGDGSLLAADPRLLVSALEAICTTAAPLHALGDVKKAVPNTKLRKPFGEATQQRAKDNALPGAVGCRMEKKKPLFYLRHIPPPPPPPPPPKPEEVLAEKLFRVVEAQRSLGGSSYPPTQARVVELTEPTVKPTLLKKALSLLDQQGRLTTVSIKDAKNPILLLGDRAEMLASGSLVELLLKAHRAPRQHAYPVEALLPKKSDIYQAFVDAANRLIESDSLPPTIGWLWASEEPLLFLLEDIRPARRTEQHRPAAPPADFARAFDEAFQRLNRHYGNHNFVSLVELRRALPLDREPFDAELRKLRVAGLYTLSGAEGRHGLTPEDREAGIREDGSLLLYVSRKLQ